MIHFGQEYYITDTAFFPSVHPIKWHMIGNYPMADDLFDHLIREMASRLLHCKSILPPHNKCFMGRYFEIILIPHPHLTFNVFSHLFIKTYFY